MTSEHGGESITSILTRDPGLPAPARVRRAGAHLEPGAVRGAVAAGQGRSRGFLGRDGRGARLDRALGEGARLAAAVREVVRRREAQRRPELRRSPLRRAAQEQGGDPLGRRAGRPPRPPLPGPPARGVPIRQRAQGAGREEGRRGRRLHADGPRAGDRAPGLRPDRGAAHRDLRRLQRRGAGRAGSRIARRRSWSPPTAATAAARSSPSRRHADGAAALCPTITAVVVYRRTGHEIAMTPGRDHWWHELDANVSSRLPPRAARQRTPAVHPLHLGLDRQAEGHPPHDRRLSRRRTLTSKWVFDLKDDDTYFCTADIGWVTGHSYLRLRSAGQRRDRR